MQALQRTGAAGISFDHRGSSGAGDAPEPTRLRAGRRHALKRGWWDSEKRQKLLQHIKKSPRSVDTERGNGGRPQAVSSSPCPGEELPLWSKLRKFLPSVDTERRNGYNTYRVRPKRSAIYEQVFSPIRGITALRTAGRLFLSDSDSYGLNVALKRSKQHHNQFYHTSHLLSDGVLTADCPWYYTCEYYNTYVYFCPYIENFPLYLLMKIGSKGRGPPAGGQFRRVSRGGTSSVVDTKKIPPFG